MRNQQQQQQQGRTSTRSVENTIRKRDVVAIGIVLVLTKMGWLSTTTTTSIPTFKGSINLQWYIPRHTTTATTTSSVNNNNNNNSSSTSRLVPTALDIDGDGIAETIVTITQAPSMSSDIQQSNTDAGANDGTSKENLLKFLRNRNKNLQWIIQVLDMKPIIIGSSSTSSSIGNTNKRHGNDDPLYNTNKGNGQHFTTGDMLYRPRVLLQSDPISYVINDPDDTDDTDSRKRFVPLDFITSHVPIRRDWIAQRVQQIKDKNKKINIQQDDQQGEQQRTIHYFCGTDWHDAAKRCEQHCPTGSGCPEGQRCYADTPCTNTVVSKTNNSTTSDNTNSITDQSLYHHESMQTTTTTPGGGIPSIFTLWSNGSVTMHSIVAEKHNDYTNITQGKKKKTKFFTTKNNNNNKKNSHTLQLKRVWTTNIPLSDEMGNTGTNTNRSSSSSSSSSTDYSTFLLDNDWSSWTDIALEYVDSYNADNGAGLLVVAASATFYKSNDITPLQPTQYRKKITCTINVLDGTVLWKSIQVGTIHTASAAFIVNNKLNTNSTSASSGYEMDPLYENLLEHRGYESSARRRSLLPSLEFQISEAKNEHDLLIDTTTSSTGGTNKRHTSTMLDTNNCLKEYRYSILTSNALPHSYYGEEDTAIRTLHFEHQSSTSSSTKSGGRRGHYGQQQSRRTGQQQQQRRMQLTNVVKNLKKKVTFGRQINNRSRKKRQLQQEVDKKTGTTITNRQKVKYGRPNVIVIHDSTGIQVRSLRNGKSVCHLSLTPHVTYADINHDGTIDVVSSIVTNDGQLRLNDDTTNNEEDKNIEDDTIPSSSHGHNKNSPWNDALTVHADQKEWIRQLLNQIQPPITKQKVGESMDGGETESNPVNENVLEDTDVGLTPLCHILALSGIPAREQLFSVDLCGRRGKQNHKRHRTYRYGTDDNTDEGIDGTAPLLVESLSHGTHRGMYDVVSAVNTGIITRVSGSTGKIEWQSTILPKLLSSSSSNDIFSASTSDNQEGLIPDWDDLGLTTLQRIDVRLHSNVYVDDDDDDGMSDDGTLAPAYRPILWTGEESMVLISPINGYVIGYVAFPQPTVTRPIVIDFNGDGTSDVIVATSDAIWGYKVKVHVQSSSLFQRILYGIVFLALLVAFLQNQIQAQPGRRCTDL